LTRNRELGMTDPSITGCFRKVRANSKLDLSLATIVGRTPRLELRNPILDAIASNDCGEFQI
jgi:hypothetical protein